MEGHEFQAVEVKRHASVSPSGHEIEALIGGGFRRDDGITLSESLGGKRMATRVAELARAGLTPDWMPGALPRCAPAIIRQNQHGTHAGTIFVGS